MKKRTIEIAVISDVHLGTPESRVQELLAYLSSIRPGILVLNGDFVDLQAASGPDFPPAHFKVLKKVLGMAASGTQVYYLIGSDEERLRAIEGTRIGNFRVQKELVLEKDGRKSLICHGNRFSTSLRSFYGLTRMGKPGYRILSLLSRWRKRFDRSPGSSAKTDHSPGRRPSAASGRIYRDVMAGYGIANGWDTVICGHTHNPVKEWIETKKGQCLYLNSGDWTEHLTALEYAFKRWKLYRYDEDKLSAFYADEELKSMNVNELLSSIVDPGNTHESK